MKTHPVDESYRTWMREAALPPGEREKLLARTLERIEQSAAFRPTDSRDAAARPAFCVSRWAWAAGFVLAMLGGLCLFQYAAGPQAEDTPKPRQTVRGYATSRATDIAQLFHGLIDLFGAGSVEWVSQENGKVSLGVAESPVRSLEDRQSVQVRIELTQQDAAGAWSTLWHTDVIVRAGHMADIVPAAVDNARLQIWATPHANDTFVFDTSLVVGGKTCVLSHQSGVAPAGVPVEMPLASHGVGGLRVIQTLLPVKETTG